MESIICSLTGIIDVVTVYRNNVLEHLIQRNEALNNTCALLSETILSREKAFAPFSMTLYCFNVAFPMTKPDDDR